MARKQRGYVELYWTCPNCQGENLGSVTTCGSCGSPQPKDVEFHQARSQELISDEEKLKRAKAGADIHCGFCGTRNPATAVTCSQCGSDLAEGARRQSAGRVVGAFKQGAAEPIKCPSCGTMNDGKALKCISCGTALSRAEKAKAAAQPVATRAAKPRNLAIGGVALLVLCAAIYFLFFRTSDVQAQVSAVQWERSIAIEAYGDVEREDWWDEVPSDAEVNSCSPEIRSVQAQPPNSGAYTEVCGTPYTVETGSGFAEVVQDCEYEVYEDYCSYTVQDWYAADTVTLRGDDLNPQWPNPALSASQRLGEESESYACIFADGDRTYTYTTESFEDFSRCQLGATFTLRVNSLGGVVSIEP